MKQEIRVIKIKVQIPDWVRTLRWITRFFPDPLFEDFHKLSVEKEILKIGQDLTELDVNATLEILENLVNLMNFAFEVSTWTDT